MTTGSGRVLTTLLRWHSYLWRWKNHFVDIYTDFWTSNFKVSKPNLWCKHEVCHE